MNRFEKKVVLVTGAGTGIGRAVAQRFAKEGADVCIIGRTEESLKETASADEKINYGNRKSDRNYTERRVD